jgi:hypothetical protein
MTHGIADTMRGITVRSSCCCSVRSHWLCAIICSSGVRARAQQQFAPPAQSRHLHTATLQRGRKNISRQPVEGV